MTPHLNRHGLPILSPDDPPMPADFTEPEKEMDCRKCGAPLLRKLSKSGKRLYLNRGTTKMHSCEREQ